jgi:hypothetical protein
MRIKGAISWMNACTDFESLLHTCRRFKHLRLHKSKAVQHFWKKDSAVLHAFFFDCLKVFFGMPGDSTVEKCVICCMMHFHRILGAHDPPLLSQTMRLRMACRDHVELVKTAFGAQSEHEMMLHHVSS